MKKKLTAYMLIFCISITSLVPAYAAEESAAEDATIEEMYETAEIEEPERTEEAENSVQEEKADYSQEEMTTGQAAVQDPEPEAVQDDETEAIQDDETVNEQAHEQTDVQEAEKAAEENSETSVEPEKEPDEHKEEGRTVTTEEIETEKNHEKMDWATREHDEESGIDVTREGVNIKEGEELRLKKEVVSDKTGKCQITWESSDKSVVSIKDGYTAVCEKAGHATLTGKTTINGKTYLCMEYQLVVVGSAEDFTFSNAINKIIYLKEDTCSDLMLYPAITDVDDAFHYYGAICTIEGIPKRVSENTTAEVEFRKERSGWEYADITIKSGGRDVTKRFLIITDDVKAKDVITVGETSLTLEKGKGPGNTNVSSIGYENGCNSIRVWSTNEEVARVNEERPGMIYPGKGGTAYIKYMFGGNRDTLKTCKVTVIAKAEKVKLDRTTANITKGYETKLKANVLPADTTDKTLKWTSSNTKVATVSSSGVVKAVGIGKAVITCASKAAPSVKAACQITVTAPVKKISLNKTSACINKGSRLTLKHTVVPAGASKTVVWKSSNTKVAKVSSAGVVTGVANGTAVITCTSKENPKLSASCKVTVKVPVTGVKLSRTSCTIRKGRSFTLGATVLPAAASNKTVSWKSSNPKVATVSRTGKVTGIKAGKAVITCTTKDGGKTAKCVITVK